MSIASKRKLKRFTVDQYLDMDRAGVFGDQRVELVFGKVYRMPAQNYSHRTLVSSVSRRLMNHFAEEKSWVVVQGTLPLGTFGSPEPDAYVLDVPQNTPEHRLPLPFLLIEVADTTYRRDSGVKLQQYATAGIQDYWIINAIERQIEVYRRPVGMTAEGFAGYEDRQVLCKGGTATSQRFPSFNLRVDDLFPPF